MTPQCLHQSDPRLPGVLSDLLETGGVVVFPTDTVYGLGGNPWDERAVTRVRHLKGRAADKPFTLHLAEPAAIARYATLDAQMQDVIELLLPGPVTLLLPAQSEAPTAVCHGGKVGVRIPDHRFFSEIVRRLNAPLFGTSVNRSGESPLLHIEAIIESFPGVDLIVDGEAGSGASSAIVDLTVDPPQVLRGEVPAALLSAHADQTDDH